MSSTPFMSLPAEVLTTLPLSLWTTDCELRFTTLVAGPGLNHQVSISPAVISREGRRGLDLRYPQHPDVSAHLRARAGETVNWLTGWGESTTACAAPLRSVDGEVIGVVGAAVDLSAVTEERRRRDSAEAVLYTFLEQGPFATAILDAGDHVIFANERYLEAVGATSQDVIGLREQALLATSADEHLPPPDEWTSSDDRRYRSVRLAVPGSGGSTLTLHAAVDISESERLRAEYDSKLEQYHALIAGSARTIALVGPQQDVQEASEGFGTMLGVSLEELAGQDLGRWINQVSREPYDALWDALRNGQVVQTERELVFSRPSGELLLAKACIRAIRGDSGLLTTLWEVDSWGEPAQQMARRDSGPELSGLDKRVLERLAVGESNAEIAEALCMSRQGLDYRLKQLRLHLGANSRGAIVARAYAEGLLSARDWPPRCRDT